VSRGPAEFYDDLAERQLLVGVNDRHRAILGWLKRFGLARGSDVLEIGCGVGTLTELIAGQLRGRGRLLAVDVSPRSVELARQRLARWPNVEVRVADALELELESTFDTIVIPDVIEHIPVELHPQLFANIRQCLADTGWVLVHMPNPLYLDWCRRNRPDLLQAVDQPVFMELLAPVVASNDLYVHYLETYSIWIPGGDYQVVVLRPRSPNAEFPPQQLRSGARRVFQGLARRAGRFRLVVGYEVKPGRGGR
jgi:SAM-dependent methyltransferase